MSDARAAAGINRLKAAQHSRDSWAHFKQAELAANFEPHAGQAERWEEIKEHRRGLAQEAERAWMEAEAAFALAVKQFPEEDD